MSTTTRNGIELHDYDPERHVIGYSTCLDWADRVNDTHIKGACVQCARDVSMPVRHAPPLCMDCTAAMARDLPEGATSVGNPAPDASDAEIDLLTRRLREALLRAAGIEADV